MSPGINAEIKVAGAKLFAARAVRVAEANLAAARAQQAAARTRRRNSAARAAVEEADAALSATRRTLFGRAQEGEAMAAASRRQAGARGARGRAARGARGKEAALVAPAADACPCFDLLALPDEVLAHAMSFWSENELGRAPQVCRSWWQLWFAMADEVRRRHARNIQFAKYAVGRHVPILLQYSGVDVSVRAVAVAPDGTAFSADGAGGDRCINVFTDDHRHLGDIDSNNSSVRCLCIGPNGDAIYAGLGDGDVRAWRFDGTPSKTLAGLPDVWCLAFGPDGDVWAGSRNGTIGRWDASGRLLGTHEGYEWGGVWSIAASPQPTGEWYSGGADPHIKKWNAAGQCLQIFEGHTGCVVTLAFGPGGSELYSGSDDRSIRVWSPDGGALRTFDDWHTGNVLCLAFSPDGRLYSGACDETIGVWNTHGKLLRTLHGHSGPVTALAFHPDGSKLYSASSDGTVRVW